MTLILTTPTNPGIAVFSEASVIVGAAGVVKDPVRASTANQGNVNLGSPPTTVDGVVLVDGDRIGVTDQTLSEENGIYRRVSAASWVRTDDFSAGANIQAGVEFYTQEGSDNSRTRSTLVTTGTIVLDTTALTFIQEGPLVRSDAAETSVKPGGAGIFNTSETAAASQMLIADVRDFEFVSVYVDITTLGSIDVLNVKGRLTGKAAPDKDVAADWAAVLADNLDTATGISLVQDYQLQITGIQVSGTGRYGPFRFPADAGAKFSARVWVDDATASVGDVFAYRAV